MALFQPTPEEFKAVEDLRTQADDLLFRTFYHSGLRLVSSTLSASPAVSNRLHKRTNGDTKRVLFADRVSRSIIELARHFRSMGSIIYFEPYAVCDAGLFREMLKLCAVLKYSAQRARSFDELLRDHDAQLEIETLGEDGLRFRTRRESGSWHSLSAYEVKMKDTAGSGD